jgi:hypothetical protein
METVLRDDLLHVGISARLGDVIRLLILMGSDILGVVLAALWARSVHR